MPAAAPGLKKEARIDVRTTAATKSLLRQAAATQDKNVSEFLIENGLIAAEIALTERRIFALDDKQWKKLQAALDAPAKARPRLRRLLNEPGAAG